MKKINIKIDEKSIPTEKEDAVRCLRLRWKTHLHHHWTSTFIRCENCTQTLRIFKVNISWQILFARTIGSVRANRVGLEKMPPGDYIPGVCSWTYHNKASYGPLSFERMSWCWCCCRKDWTLFCHFPIISQPMYVFHRQIDAATTIPLTIHNKYHKNLLVLSIYTVKFNVVPLPFTSRLER